MNKTFTLLFSLLFSGLLSAQNTYLMGDTSMTTDCNGIFYDDGGAGFPGFYSPQLSSQDVQIFTICPENAGCIVMDFQEFVTEKSSNLGPGDVLYVYDGPDTSHPLIGAYSGSLLSSNYSFGRIIGGSGCLTFLFDENGGFGTLGWEASWTCFVESCQTEENFGPPVDCIDAVMVCGDETLNYNSNGAGEEELISQDIQGCITSGERESMWINLRIEDTTPPNTPLTFTIVPRPGGEDYDFAIYGPNQACGELEFPIRCSYAEEVAAGTLETGLRMGETDTSESPTLDNEANPANGFVAPILVNPGEHYYIMVNNFSSDYVGFDMIWGEEILENEVLDCAPCEHSILMPKDFETCVGDSFTFSPVMYGGSGMFDYEWTTSIEELEFSTEGAAITSVPADDFLGEITYFLKVTDLESGNCFREAEVTVTITENINISIQNLADVYCVTDSPVQLTANPSGGTFTGIGIEGNEFNPSIAGVGTHIIQYNYTSSASECGYHSEKTVEVVEPLNMSIPVCTDITPTTMVFEWESIEGADGYELNYTIGGDETMSEALPSTTTDYTLTDLSENTEIVFNILAVSEICGESDVATVSCTTPFCPNITPIITTDLFSFYCNADAPIALVGTPSGGTFIINGEEVEQFDPSATGLGNISILYEYTDLESGCTYASQVNTEVVSVTIAPTPQCTENSLNSVTFEWDTNLQLVESYTVSYRINGGLSKQENLANDVHTFTIEDLQPSSFVELNLISSGLCGISEIGVANCSTKDCPALEVSLAELEPAYCHNDASIIVLQGEPAGGIFSLNDTPLEENQISPIDLQVGDYDLVYTFTDENNNCSYTESLSFEILATPMATFAASDTTILEGESITFTADEQEALTYIWRVDEVIVSSSANYTFTSENAGTYSVSLEVLSNDGCTAISDDFEVVVEMDTAIEVHPFFASLQVQPNPAKNLLQLSLNASSPTPAQLQWYNAQGKLVAAESLQIGQGKWHHSVNVSDFAVGVYYLHLQTEKGVVVEKVLVVR